MEKTCMSCGKSLTNLTGSALFKCPQCDASEIVRCFYCRRLGTKYTCAGCGFSGPN